MRSGILNRLAGPDAEQHVVRGASALFKIVRVVGRDERQVHLASELDQAVVELLLLLDAVTHDLDVEAVAEDVAVDLGGLLGPLVVVVQQRLRAQARHAAGEDDEAVVMLGQQIEVDPRLVIVALQEALRDQRDEVAVADQVGGQQRHVRLVADGAVEPPARRDVGLAADDRHERVLAGGVVELHGAEHDAVVGQGDAGGAVLRGALAERVDATSSVQQRILAVNVQMDEFAHLLARAAPRPLIPTVPISHSGRTDPGRHKNAGGGAGRSRMETMHARNARRP